jgi:protein-disulfide isomerase
MVDCEFCGKSFSSDQALHLHWQKHTDQLTSHQQDQLKKAKKHEEHKQQHEQEKKQQRKKIAGYGLVAALLIALLGTVIAQSSIIQLDTGSDKASVDPGQFNLEQQPVIGDENAPVTVVEFGDFRCPHCRNFELSVVPQLKSNYIDTSKARFHFINLPVLGPESTKMAVGAECILQQDQRQYWDFHHAAFENQGAFNTANAQKIVDLARESTEELNYDKLSTCIQTRATSSQVSQDTSIASSNNVQSTPTVFVNGRQISNPSYSNIADAIDQALGN